MNKWALVRMSFFSAIALTAAVATSNPEELPAARTVDATDESFGLRLPDPYRWMEGEGNAEFDAWLRAQGAFARTQLDRLPRQAYWRQTLDRVAAAGTINRLQQPMGGRIFFLRLTAGREGVLMVRDRNGHERTLLDPRAQPHAAQTADITGFNPAPDGRSVAVNVQHGGSELSDIVVINAGDGKQSRDKVTDVWGEFQANWLPDGSGFTYTQLAPPAVRDKVDPMLGMRVRFHRVGTDPGQDPVLLASGTNASVTLEPQEFPSIDVQRESGTAVLVIGGARPQLRLCVAPRREALRPDARWNCLVGYDDNVQNYALQGSRLYLTSMRGHPNGQLEYIDLTAHGTVRVVAVREDPVAVLSGLAAARDGLYLRRMRGGPDELLHLPYAQSAAQPLTLPYQGAVYILNADPRADGAVITLQGWTHPRAALKVRAGKPAAVDLHLGADAPADYSGILAEEVSARSADGTEVPLTILHQRGSGSAQPGLAILDGYGAYGISLQPVFDPFILEWVRAGHVYAVAHVRGGGEKGDQWRIGGSGEHKERGIEDFIACAESLVARGWADRGRVVALGGSAGGILVGGAMTRSPATFSAVLIQSGMLTPSRLLASKNGSNQFAEFGDPRTEAGMRALAAMDPYQRLRAGTAYPAVLLVVGLNDNRVVPWASGKFGARLAALVGNARPVWIRTDEDMGHFTTAQASLAREDADLYSFAEAEGAAVGGGAATASAPPVSSSASTGQ